MCVCCVCGIYAYRKKKSVLGIEILKYKAERVKEKITLTLGLFSLSVCSYVLY